MNDYNNLIQNKTGILLNEQNIKLQRLYFKQMLELRGITVLFRAPRETLKQYNSYGELDARYYPPVRLKAIYDEHPVQRTMKKLGWDAQLSDNTTLIHVPYNLEGVQAGALFIIPSGLDNAPPATFRVARMSSIAVFPAAITCELVPEWENTMQAAEVVDFSKSNFNVLYDPAELEDQE